MDVILETGNGTGDVVPSVVFFSERVQRESRKRA